MTIEPEKLYSRQLKELFNNSLNTNGLLSTSNTMQYYINNGLGWNIAYSFTVAGNSTAYLAFETGTKRIHAVQRKIKVVNESSQEVGCTVTTLKNATVDTLGTDISDTTIFNADLNSDNGINLTMYDETTTISDEGTEAPFSSTIIADRKSANQEFITNQYILRENGIRVLKFENITNNDLIIEYASTGYQEETE